MVIFIFQTVVYDSFSGLLLIFWDVHLTVTQFCHIS